MSGCGPRTGFDTGSLQWRPRAARPRGPRTLSGVSIHAAVALSLLLLSACNEKPVIVTSVDTFCTRVERFHATEAERASLKANSGPLERVIRWVAGINKQYDSHCLQPAKGA